MTPDILAIVIGTIVQLAGLAYIANQNRKMNDKMIVDDMAIFLQGRRTEEIIREMRETLLRSNLRPLDSGIIGHLTTILPFANI